MMQALLRLLFTLQIRSRVLPVGDVRFLRMHFSLNKGFPSLCFLLCPAVYSENEPDLNNELEVSVSRAFAVRAVTNTESCVAPL